MQTFFDFLLPVWRFFPLVYTKKKLKRFLSYKNKLKYNENQLKISKQDQNLT